ncbi:hypothetical protein TorRG33x02_042180 [Trema orientale]|uniref:Uncharacterized protein n=1 Tax=Trema orientale TaxID=63057 RepID=A0A2P5FQR7_TREOI|nr:hypothetical protein TorRG33x02_042180 [Trema orientale]
MRPGPSSNRVKPTISISAYQEVRASEARNAQLNTFNLNPNGTRSSSLSSTSKPKTKKEFSAG